MAQPHAPHRRQTSASSTSTTRAIRTKRASSPLYGRRLAHGALSRSSSTRSRDSAASSSSSEPPRSILGPLQSNLRRLPSRLRLLGHDTMVRSLPNASHGIEDGYRVGNKRKRIVSGNENQSAGRVSNSAPRMKRQRSEDSSRYGSDEDNHVAASEMDVDESSQQAFPSPEDTDEDFDPSDHYWLFEADSRALVRLRKEELVRLYQAAGLADDAESLTKPVIAQAIIDAREDAVTLPPSSPPGRDNGSDYSSDDGNTAEDESPTRPSPRDVIRRRITVGDLALPSGSKRAHLRSASMGYLPSLDSSHASSSKRQIATRSPTESSGGVSRRRTASLLAADPSTTLPSPPATRRRSSRASSTQTTSANSATSKGKGKAKHVEFADAMTVTRSTRSNNSSRSSAYRADGEDSDLSDLTELTSDEENNVEATPRPKQRPKSTSEENANRRRTPARKAKAKVGNMCEESDISTDEELAQLASPVSSRSPTPPPVHRGRKTPLKNRLRPRPGMQTHTPPSDGDDENEEEQEDELIVEEEEDVEDEVAEEDEGVMEVTPKRLRSGKIRGEDAASDEEDEEDELVDEDAGSVVDEDTVEDDVTAVAEDASEDMDTEDAEDDAEDDDEAEEGDEVTEDVDLAAATAKTLVRLRRDELVRLCESREIEAEGTKPQLAEALIQWRDQQQVSAPSSTGTVRPPSTVRAPSRGRHKSSREGTKTPILLRTHVHVHQPRTPPVSSPSKPKEGVKDGDDGELELDLAGLGLVDKEIPCDKLSKLEKIGSGGFKDVYVGKLKNRKVAIAEFRGQLTAMDIKELKLLGGFDHPNIVRFLGVSIPENTKETPVMIVSELCSNGDLFDYVRNVPAPKLSKVLGLMLDIAKGLEYLHNLKPSIIHRDCKSSNILITSRVTAKIADFGLAKVKQSTRSMVRSLVGTVNWQAPELWSPHPKYNHKVDVFSCAMVFWEMLQWHLPNKKFPWEGMNEHAIYDIVGAKRQRPSITGLKKQWCPEIVELMERMWAHEHQDRPNMSKVVQEVERLVKLYK